MQQVEVKFRNTTNELRAVCIEPWAGIWELAPGQELVVVIDAPSTPKLEWEWGYDDRTDMLAVMDPAGTGINVLRDGNRAPADR